MLGNSIGTGKYSRKSFHLWSLRSSGIGGIHLYDKLSMHCYVFLNGLTYIVVPCNEPRAYGWARPEGTTLIHVGPIPKIHTHSLSFSNPPPGQAALSQILQESVTDLQLHFSKTSRSSHILSSAEANHWARPALSSLGLRMRARESLHFSNLAESKKSNQKLVLLKAVGVQSLTLRVLKGLVTFKHPKEFHTPYLD